MFDEYIVKTVFTPRDGILCLFDASIFLTLFLMYFVSCVIICWDYDLFGWTPNTGAADFSEMLVPATWLAFNMMLVIWGCCWWLAAVYTWRTPGAKPADIPFGTSKPSKAAAEWMCRDSAIRPLTTTRRFPAVEPTTRNSVRQQCGWRQAAGSHKGRKKRVWCSLQIQIIWPLLTERLKQMETLCHIWC